MASGSCQGIMYSIATTEILPWLQHAAVVIGGKNGAGALHTRIRPVSVRQQEAQSQSNVRVTPGVIAERSGPIAVTQAVPVAVE
jgi:hypothetical protein